jgi:hypothetical protein
MGSGQQTRKAKEKGGMVVRRYHQGTKKERKGNKEIEEQTVGIHDTPFT